MSPSASRPGAATGAVSAASSGGRELRLARAHNVRDLGGLTTTDGRQTRRGRLYRGELLPELVAADVEILVRGAGLRGVVDLRTRGEVKHNPGSWADHQVAWVHCPLNLGTMAPVPGPEADYVSAYLSFLEAGPDPVVLAARTLMNPDFQPALFHCAAGKDRTGVVSALLLDVLGVVRQEIGADYAMTNAGLALVLERLAALEPYRRTLTGAVAEDHAARAETIVTFLEALDERHGGAEAWLLHHGVSAGEVTAYRQVMLA